MLSMRRALLTTAATALACSQIGLGTAQELNPWGLRNFEILPAGVSPSTFGGHGAGNVAFWLFWGNVQPYAGQPYCSITQYPFANDYDVLDDGLDIATSFGADAIIGFDLRKGFGQGAHWGFGSVNGIPQPCNLLAEPGPKGYCVALYDVVYDVALHIADEAQYDFQGQVYMRFYNESWSEWPFGSNAAQSLTNYIHSYLTFRMAIEDAEAATGRDIFKVGHGSIPRGRLGPKYVMEQAIPPEPEFDGAMMAGQVPPVNLEWILGRLKSYTERNQCILFGSGRPYSTVTAPISTWAEALAYNDPENSRNAQLDAWLDKYVEWTANDYFEFTTGHTHGKPFFIETERDYFDDLVRDYDPNDAYEPPEWVAAESAFELHDQQSWGLFDCHDDEFTQFVAEDYARKWITQAGNEIRFCSPVYIGTMEYPEYLALLRKPGTTPAPTGCGTSTCSSPPPIPPGCGDQPCSTYSDLAFINMADTVGAFTSKADLSSGIHAHYRFTKASGDVIDVVWRRTLFDSASTTSNVVVNAPPGGFDENDATVTDIYGDPAASTTGTGSVTLTDLGQPPRVVVWTSN